MQQTDFIHLGLSQSLLRALVEKGYESPTDIQTQSIPAILDGRDVIAQSQTGTGKTAAFALPVLQKLNPRIKKPQVFILCPTRELALQVCSEIKDFSKYQPQIKCTAIYGGEPIGSQLRRLRSGIQIIVGTPGRIIDHLKRKTISTAAVRTVVLDEADEMLNMGFLEDIRFILNHLPEERQTLLFSATISVPILDIAKQYQTHPKHINISKTVITVPAIEQYYYEIPKQKKVDLLCRLCESHQPQLALIFCNTKKQVDELTSALQLRGYPVKGLHGDMNQETRNHVISGFHRGRFQMLVATDVAARGLDISGVEAVFNYDIPMDTEYYVHRIGRTGRAGKAGLAFSFVSSRQDFIQLKNIQHYTKTKIHSGQIPSNCSLVNSRVEKLVASIQKILQEDDVEEYEPIMDQIMDAQDCTSVQIACALIKTILSDQPGGSLEEIIQNHPFSNSGESSGNSKRSGSKGSGKRTRLFISLGSEQKVGAGDLIQMITGLGSLKDDEVKNIKVLQRYSFVDVPTQHVDHLLRASKGQKLKGNRFSLQRAAVK